jgi:hypothetical protein
MVNVCEMYDYGIIYLNFLPYIILFQFYRNYNSVPIKYFLIRKISKVENSVHGPNLHIIQINYKSFFFLFHKKMHL